MTRILMFNDVEKQMAEISKYRRISIERNKYITFQINLKQLRHTPIRS